jgi:hypothetical protein
MTTSLKSFAALALVLGILNLGTASAALAKGEGPSGGGNSGHMPSSPGMSKGPNSPSAGKSDKHDSYRFEHDKDYHGNYRYGCYPGSLGYSSYCCPQYTSYCYSPSYCCESAPQFCAAPVCCPSPLCYEPPCYSYCPEYFSSYCCPEHCDYNHYRPSYKDYDRNKDREYSKHEEDSKSRRDGHDAGHVANSPHGPPSMSKSGPMLASSGHGGRR